MRGPVFFMLVASLALITGCTKVGPDFATPPALVADKWLEHDDPAIDTSRQEYQDWWSVFEDPVLDRLIDLAYRQNLDLQTAGIRVLQARAQLGIAIGSFYPQQQQAAGSLSYNQLSQEAPTALPPPFDKRIHFWQASLGAQLAWELDFWGKFRRQIESADAAFLASVAAYDNALVSLTADVANAYIGIRTLEEQVRIAKENVVKETQSLAIAEVRYAGGAVSKRDVAQAENVLGATEATIPQLQMQLQQTKNALSVLLGLAPSDLTALLRAATSIPTAPEKVAVGIPADLLRRRPDIRTAELQAAAQSAQIGVAKADLYPAFRLVGDFTTLTSNVGEASLGNLFSANSFTYSVGPSFQWNILNSGQITNNVRLQDAKLEEALSSYKSAVLKAQQEVENGLTSFVQSRAQAGFLEKSVRAANEALDIATLQYRQGTADFTTVLTAEQNLYQAENNLAVARGSIPTALVAVYRALGGGWQLREGHDFVPTAVQERMKNRTDWGGALMPPDPLRPTAPGLPSPQDLEPNIRPPEW